MKKNRFIAFVSAISLSAGFLFSSCYDNIYSLIEKEVAIDDSGLNGDISNIVRCGSYLFLANGKIYGKENKPLSEVGRGNWKSVTMPVSGASEFNVSNRVQAVAADDTYVYALALYYEEDDNGANDIYKRELYAAETTNFPNLTWNKVDTASVTGTHLNSTEIKIIFDNKATSSRTAYANIYGNVYKLSGTAVPSLVTIPSGNLIDTTDTATIMNAINFNGSDWFSKYYCLAANDTFLYFAKAYTTGSTNSVTYSNSISFMDKSGNTYSQDTKYSVLSLTLTSDYLFYGTNGGLERCRINDTTKIPEGRVSFDNNGGSIISSHVYMVYAYDQTVPMSQTDLYCASTIYGSISSSSDSYDDVGLYACPAGGNWNRDGD